LLCLIWKARAKKFDMGFSVKETVEESGQPPAVLEAPLKCSMEMPIQGRIAPEPYHRTVTLHFDNFHSALQSKTVVFWVAIGENVSQPLTADEGDERRLRWAAVLKMSHVAGFGWSVQETPRCCVAHRHTRDCEYRALQL
jgi:hypothetical protein